MIGEVLFYRKTDNLTIILALSEQNEGMKINGAKFLSKYLHEDSLKFSTGDTVEFTGTKPEELPATDETQEYPAYWMNMMRIEKIIENAENNAFKDFF